MAGARETYMIVIEFEKVPPSARGYPNGGRRMAPAARVDLLKLVKRAT
jgi:hypothetical protein